MSGKVRIRRKYGKRKLFGWVVSNPAENLRIPVIHLVAEEVSLEMPDVLVAVAMCDRRRKFHGEIFRRLGDVRGASHVCRECQEISKKYKLGAGGEIPRPMVSTVTEETAAALEG